MAYAFYIVINFFLFLPGDTGELSECLQRPLFFPYLHPHPHPWIEPHLGPEAHWLLLWSSIGEKQMTPKCSWNQQSFYLFARESVIQAGLKEAPLASAGSAWLSRVAGVKGKSVLPFSLKLSWGCRPGLCLPPPDFSMRPDTASHCLAVPGWVGLFGPAAGFPQGETTRSLQSFLKPKPRMGSMSLVWIFFFLGGGGVSVYLW